MSRRAESWATCAANLHRALDDAPEWVSDADAMRLALSRLRADALALVEALGPTGAARALGVGETTLRRWRAPQGWLAVPPR